MMTYTELEAAKNLEAVLSKAENEGEVRITTPDGKSFAILRIPPSPTPVTGVSLKPPVTVDEIVSLIREGRERDYGIK